MKRRSELRTYGDRTVEVTNLDKPLFPDEGLTKGDVLEHVVAVAPRLLPGLVDRALSMERFVDGLRGRGFFHKHVPDHFPDWVRTTVTETSSGPMTQVVVDDLAALVLVTNFGCLTPHVPIARVGANPDHLVIDLDPADELDVARIRRAGLAVRTALVSHGLAAFPRWSGSRGLHVVSPLDGTATYGDVLRFTTSLAEGLVADHPDLLTLAFKKADRGDRLYVDVMRNAPGATVVASWGLRVRPGAPLAMPVTWEEVERTGPRSYTVANARERLELEPWDGFEGARRGLPRLG